VWDDLEKRVERNEPRALELAYALSLSFEGVTVHPVAARAKAVPPVGRVIDPDLKTMLDVMHAKYDAFKIGVIKWRDAGSEHVLGFERVTDGERVVVFANLGDRPAPVKFRELAGREGWDILNSVEFTFPPRAQLEGHEILWLFLEK
jgi:hypothetical protein